MESAVLIAPTPAAPAKPDVRVVTISDYESFRTLEPLWNNLVEAAGVDHPFLSFEWVCTWWESFGQGKKLHVLVVKDGMEPIAIAPLMVSHGRMYGLKVRRLESIGNVHTQRFGFIITRLVQQTYQAIWKHLLEEAPHWDVLRLSQLPAISKSLEEFPRLARGDDFPWGIWQAADSPYLPLSGTWESYLKSLDAKHRSNLRNRLKRLSQCGAVAVETITAAVDVTDALADGLRLEAAAWKGHAGTAISCRPSLRRFYMTFAERMAERKWLRLYFLTVDGRRIAFHYSVCCRGTLYLLKPGYDPAFAPYSPVNLLCYLVLQEAFASGLTEYEFLGATEPWKLEWTGRTKSHYWLFVFSKSWRSRLLYSVKFRLIPALQQWPSYGRVRNALVKLRATERAWRRKRATG